MPVTVGVAGGILNEVEVTYASEIRCTPSARAVIGKTLGVQV